MNHQSKLKLSVILGAVLFGSLAGCSPDGSIDDRDEDVEDEPAREPTAPRPQELRELSVRAGEAFQLDGRTVLAPPPGSSLFRETLYETGKTEILRLRSELDGRVFLIEEHIDVDEDDEPMHGQGSATGEKSNPDAPGPCVESPPPYVLEGSKWASALQWRFNDGSTPADVSKTEAAAKLQAAASNITQSKNSCGLADEVSATHSYLGTTTKSAQVDSSGSCTGSDGVNVVSFGALPSGTLGVTCYWYSGGKTTEADMKLNKSNTKWTTTPSSADCSNRWSVEGVATHEWGHAFGLDHVGESKHGNQTMSPFLNGPCQNSEATLGNGDVAGLRAIY